MKFLAVLALISFLGCSTESEDDNNSNLLSVNQENIIFDIELESRSRNTYKSNSPTISLEIVFTDPPNIKSLTDIVESLDRYKLFINFKPQPVSFKNPSDVSTFYS